MFCPPWYFCSAFIGSYGTLFYVLYSPEAAWHCVTDVILFGIKLSLCSENEFAYSTRPEHTRRPCPSQCCQAKGHLSGKDYCKHRDFGQRQLDYKLHEFHPKGVK